MTQKLSRSALTPILQNKDIAQLSAKQLVNFFKDEIDNKYIPDGICKIDPRNGERVIYSSSRSRRPHDNRPEREWKSEQHKECFICHGKTTGVLDWAALNEGFTFINKNLYPILFVDHGETSFPPVLGLNTHDIRIRRRDIPARGLHFLQWTSSYHNKDWHNMPPLDSEIVFQRLAALEGKLLREWPNHFVGIIKNEGYLVGGSVEHGHQQIALSNIAPRRFLEDWRFEKDHGETFTSHLRRESSDELRIRDYGPALLVTPYFMRRPYDMVLLAKNENKGTLHELSEAELSAFAQGWHDALRALRALMLAMGKEIAYNVIVHNGTGHGLYCEFLPYTQETGGYEHLGLSVCQLDPLTSSARLREFLQGKENLSKSPKER